MDQLNKLKIGDVQISARGAKTAQVTLDGNIKLTLNVAKGAVTSPFGANTFGPEESNRRSIEFTLSPEAQGFWQAFDHWAIAYLSKHSERIFKTRKTEKEIAEGYKAPVIKKGDYEPHLKCKINMSGGSCCRFWNAAGQRCTMVADLRGIPLKPRVVISHLWQMQREYGFVVQVCDLMCLEEETACPFEMTD